MKKQIVFWAAASCLLVISLVLASCGKAATPQETQTATTTSTAKATTGTTTPSVKPTTPTTTSTVTPTATKSEPKYGGTFTLLQGYDCGGFDPYRYNYTAVRYLASNCYEGLGIGDWARGPGGANEYTFNGFGAPLKFARGALAESWELSPDGLTMTFHLRKGIHFQNKAPANGRELVANDVKYAWDRRSGTGSGFTQRTPYNFQTGMDVIKEITTPDKYTVVFNCSKFNFNLPELLVMGYESEVYPPEVVQTYGNIDDWHNVCGTGAYILADYVSASGCTFKKNPDYWGYDELHPKNKLPYADEYRSLYIADESTRLAAMRSGKGDMIQWPCPDWRVTDQLKRTNPELQFFKFLEGYDTAMYIRQDVKPLDDLRVRQALQMSLDTLAINQTVGGGCDRYTSALTLADGEDLYTPFDQLPKDVQEVLTYNPTKAKQLLTEAGYPKGFELEVVYSVPSVHAEVMPLAADYFGRIGVTLKTVTKDSTTRQLLLTSATYNQTLAYSIGGPTAGTWFPRLCGPFKYVKHNDQFADDLWTKIQTTVDTNARNKMMKELNAYMIGKVFYVGIVARPDSFSVAQPWVGGWHGEAQLRYHDPGSVVMRLWIDQDMKKAMGK